MPTGLTEPALKLLRTVLVRGVADDQPDLTMRQMAVLLTVYITAQPHTVRGLAVALNISKPAVTRALDRLGDLDLARRKRDEADKRSVLVQRTVRGSVYLSELAELIGEASISALAEARGQSAQ
jgi:DNA-binding MarR family transcriptional regulator